MPQFKRLKSAKGNSGTGNRTLGSAVLISQLMRARNVSHYTIPDDAAYTSTVGITHQECQAVWGTYPPMAS
ncbi:hypothetical protein LB504_006244 [Fusarium proliferatum]|nr:hypothetical protein LB504_006244 [Fusarium proliferatum]